MINVRCLLMRWFSAIALIFGLTELLSAQPAVEKSAVEVAPGDFNAEVPHPLQFRRVYVPSDRLVEVAGKGFRPMSRQDFERVTELLDRHNKSPEKFSEAAILRGDYYATLDGEDALRGQAVLEIERRATGFAAIPIKPLNLALTTPFWQETNLPATAGVDREGDYVVLTRREQRLSFSWSRQGILDPFGATDFTLELPEAAQRRVWIDLPQELQIEASGGLSEELETHDSPTTLLNLPPPDPGTRRWRIDVFGKTTLVLRVSSRGRDLTSVVTSVRHSSIYDLSPESVSLSEDIRLFVQGSQQSELTLNVGNDLRITAARLDDQPVPWRVAADDPSRVTLRFPEAIDGDGHILRLSAIAPCHVGAPWRLPAVRVSNVDWQSGRSEIRVSEGLVLEHLVTRDCVQVQSAPLAASSLGRALSFRHYSANAGLTLTLKPRHSRVACVSATQVDFGLNSASATTSFDLRAIQGERFIFLIDLAADWMVDSITASSFNDDTMQNLIEREVIPSAESDARTMEVRLQRALRANEEMRLVVKARRRLSGENASLFRQDLRVVELRDVEEEKRYIALQPEASYRITLSNESDIRLLNPAQLPEDAKHLIVTSGASVVFADNPVATGIRASLTRAAPSFTATFLMEAIAASTSLRETYTITVNPTSSHVDRLRFHFSNRREQPLRWSWKESPEKQLTAERVEGDDAEGETWDISLDRSRDTSFTLVAERFTAVERDCKLSFASSPQAHAQSGELVVSAMPDIAITLDKRGLKAIPPSPPNFGTYPSVVGMFRFEPAQSPEASVFWIDSSQQPYQPRTIWLPNCRLTSDYPQFGAPRHIVTIEIENTGRKSLDVTLPATANLGRVLVDGADVHTTGYDSSSIRIPLPDNVRHPEVVMEYRTPPRATKPTSILEPPFPDFDVPVLSREWNVRTPSSLAVAKLHRGDSITYANATWSQRMFGPLLNWSNDHPAFELPEGLIATRPERDNSSTQAEIAKGWSNVHISLPKDETAQIVVYQRDVVAVLEIIVFIAVAAIAFWFFSKRFLGIVLLSGLFAAAALVAPPPYFQLAAAAFLAFLAAAILRLVSPSVSYVDRDYRKAARSSALESPITRLIIIGLLASGVLGRNVVKGDPNPPTRYGWQPVFFPLDSEGQISETDRYVYVTESLFKALHQAAKRFEASPRSWLIRSADYRATCSWTNAGAEIGCERISIGLEIEVLASPTRFVAPEVWRTAEIDDESVRLDGSPISFDAARPGDELGLTFEHTGIYRLTFDVLPAVRLDGARRRIEFAVPRVGNARLKVLYPGPVETVEVGNTLGAIELDEQGGVLQAAIGPVDQITFSWPHVFPQNVVSSRQPHVEQYAWLHIQPDALVTDVNWKFLGDDETITAIDVVADDNLLFLPSTARGLASFSQARRDGFQALRLVFDAPRRTPFDFQASFVVQGGAGVGVCTAPRIEIQNSDIARRTLAISVDPTLELSAPKTQRVESITESAFQSDWPEAQTTPQLAYRLSDAQWHWSAECHFLPSMLTGSSNLDVVCRSNFAWLSYRASLDASQGSIFLLRLRLPVSFEIKHVSVSEGGVERVDHWSQLPTGELTIFLNGRSSADLIIQVQGRMALDEQDQPSLPLIELDEANQITETYRIFRGPDTLVKINQIEGFSEHAISPPVDNAHPEQGRLVAVLAPLSNTSKNHRKVTLDLEPNQPETTFQHLVTRVGLHDDQWIFESIVDIEVTKGAIDLIRLEAPEQIAGPFVVDPPGHLEVYELPHLQRRILLLRPETALTGRRQLRVSGIIKAPSGESLRAPNVELLDFSDASQFLVLPLVLGSEPLAWTTYGMRAEDPPADVNLDPSYGATISYRVVNRPRYGATMRYVETVPGKPIVHLAHIHTMLHGNERFVAQATYDLTPAGLRQCVLQLPEGASLVHAAQEGLTASPLRLGDRHYRFDLGGERLPMRLTVVYEGRSGSKDNQSYLTLLAPKLLDIPAARTLWAVTSHDSHEKPRILTRHRALSRRQYDILRLKSLEKTLSLPSEIEAERSPAELARWYAGWEQHWIALRDMSKFQISETSRAVAFPSLDALDRFKSGLDTKYKVAESSPRVAEKSAASRGAFDDNYLLPSVFVECEGDALSVRVERTSRNGGISTWQKVAMLFTVVALICGVGHRLQKAEWTCRFLPFFLALLGVGWWLWLSPAFIGLAIAASGLWLGSPKPRTTPVASDRLPSSLAHL